MLKHSIISALAIVTIAGAAVPAQVDEYGGCLEKARFNKEKSLKDCAGKSGDLLTQCKTRIDEAYKSATGKCSADETARLNSQNARNKQKQDTAKQRGIDAARRSGQPLPR